MGLGFRRNGSGSRLQIDIGPGGVAIVRCDVVAPLKLGKKSWGRAERFYRSRYPMTVLQHTPQFFALLVKAYVTTRDLSFRVFGGTLSASAPKLGSNSLA